MAKTQTATLRQDSLGSAVLLPSLSGLLREWLPRQRWFAGKGRPVTDLALLSVTELQPVCLHVLIRADHAERPAAGPAHDCYQLLLGTEQSPSPRPSPALLGRATEGPLAGLLVYDALHEPRSSSLLLERLRTSDTTDALHFERDWRVSIPAGLTPRLLEAEQSNSSLVYGDAYILKIFRRVRPGINPDLEVPRALARQGCTRVPAPVAWFRTTSPWDATLGVLQPFLRGGADGWTQALEALASAREFTAEAFEMGRATAEVHLALAAAFSVVSQDATESRRLATGMAGRLRDAIHAVPDLLPYASGLRSAFAELATLDTPRPAQRIHGDLHLGQVLRAEQEWHVIDFEGEPARPLPERRRAQSPVRDVAGMLRSFDYAAHARRPWHPQWALRCREAYCAGYAAESGWDPRAEPALLRAYETDRAVYEVVYEARHRPDWLPVPMAAVARLADAPG
ncbi:maltokinase N-terminal cap-like domain-containing protein [Streptomyces chiangmaiensis]|uniref:Maltokinase n=1 Tax=Streptomyces chiangmaiensis TaxID=766497 RepID=A0ABU7FQE0_9ACTN|nr:maltokinase [Streptomyces chiangmaiensis]MED7826165.1 maltokinase [Streptomyces chiangmaiensis]